MADLLLDTTVLIDAERSDDTLDEIIADEDTIVIVAVSLPDLSQPGAARDPRQCGKLTERRIRVSARISSSDSFSRKPSFNSEIPVKR
ncbi:hypothetical protein [Candidatus Poriferisodalis sp.]|uniref:hypothetical protein n=1 Tax=Candidatus Poriferisodalis sp. TaxID=3101277 RepID=UPI003B018196